MLIQAKEEAIPRFDPISGAEYLSVLREMVGGDPVGLVGSVHAILRNGDGEISHEAILKNLITQVGDQLYGERGAGIASPPALITGMRLGNSASPAAVSKTATPGATLSAYKAGSNAAIAATFPTSSLSGSSRRIQFKSSWAAGIATDTTLSEAILVNDTIATDATSALANVISRVLLSPVINKGASDTLDLIWNQDLLGA